MDGRARLYEIYWTLRRVIAPQLRYAQNHYEDILKRYVHPDMRWLEIGCGHSILPPWRAAEEDRLVKRCEYLVGIDYDLGSLKAHARISRKLRGDIARLPFREESFDLATANMVVEHLDNPAVQFREIGRVLKPKGVFLFHTPNAYGYGVLATRLVPESLKTRLIAILEGRQEHDVFETHYAANTEQQIRDLAAKNGFEVIDMELVTTDAIFAIVPPLAVFELLWLRLLMTERLRSLRTNLIVALRKVQ